MGFNLDRRMYDVLQCMPTIPGAVGAFRRSALERVGGMSDDTLAEDTDITMAIHRDGWRVVYAEKARAWTEASRSSTRRVARCSPRTAPLPRSTAPSPRPRCSGTST